MAANPEFDFYVIGGGLSGLSFSIQAARRGYAVKLSEKGDYPRHKVCGEYLSMESVPFLLYLLPGIQVHEFPHIKNLRLSSAAGAYIERALGMGGIGISRFLLDDLLCKSAIESGVDVSTHDAVQRVDKNNGYFVIESESGTFRARHVIGAFGKRSGMDTVLQRKYLYYKKSRPQHNYVGVKYHITSALPPDTIELHNFPGGYCGVSKIESEKYCLCYIVETNRLKPFRGDITRFQHEVLLKNKRLAPYLDTAQCLFQEPITISNVWFGNKSVYENEVFMTGDAAGMVAPLSGNGMSMALHASYILFELFNEYFEGKISFENMVRRYQVGWNQMFRLRVNIGRILQQLLLHPQFSNTAIRLFRLMPALLDFVVIKTHGRNFYTNQGVNF